jgi:hypothetical protein
MARRRGNRIKVWVQISGNRKYGFQTQEVVHNRLKENLGQTAFSGASGVFFGANAPKPPRATLEESTGSVSSFCGTNKVADLKKTAGWTVTDSGTIRGVRTSGKTRTVYVDMPGGWKYAWNITAAEADRSADLGFELATGADASGLVWGVGEPKPPRAYLKEAEGMVSSFIKPQQSVIDAAVAKGWTVTSIDYALLPD